MRGSSRGHFFSALAGLVVGVMLVAVLPAGADNGDPLYLGQANSARATTRVNINYGMVIRSFRADVPAATFKVSSGAPIAVNSTGLVANLNADLLDGDSGASYRSEGVHCEDTSGADPGNAVECVMEITLAVPGTLYVSGSGKARGGVAADTLGCDIVVDGEVISESIRMTTVGIDEWGMCASTLGYNASPGKRTVKFVMRPGSNIGVGEISAFLILLPA